MRKYTLVLSSHIREMAWERSTMYVRYKNGSEYAYDGVSRSLFEKVLKSPSVGRAMQELQKEGRRV